MPQADDTLKTAENKQDTEPKGVSKVGREIWLFTKDKVLGGTILLVIGAIAGWWFLRAPALRYSVDKVYSYSTDKGTFHIRIGNVGSTSAEQVDCEIRLDYCEIKSLTAKPTLFQTTVTIDPGGKRAFVSVPRLNAGDELDLEIEATNPFQIEKTLTISLRGKDVSGKEDGASLWSPWTFLGGILLTMVLVVALLGSLSFGLNYLIARQEEKRRVAFNENAEKVFRFLNGPLEGRFVTGSEAKRLYTSMVSKHTELPIAGVTYHLYAREKLDATIKLEMVCSDVAGEGENAKEEPDSTASAEATAAWNQVVKELGEQGDGLIGEWAKLAESAVVGEGKLRLAFYRRDAVAQKSCERTDRRNKLEKALKVVTGKQWTLEFASVPDPE